MAPKIRAQYRKNSGLPQAQTKAKPKKPDPPTSANNYATKTYDFAHPMDQPADWIAMEKKQEWCKYHGGCMHKTEDCRQAIDDCAKSKGQPLPSVAAAATRREMKLKKRRQERADQGAADRATIHQVSIHANSYTALTNVQ